MTPSVENSIILIKGKSGTGKSELAGWFAEKLKFEQIVAGTVVKQTAYEFKKNNTDRSAIHGYLNKEKPGILIIDNVHEDAEYLHEMLNGLKESKKGVICVLLGLDQQIDEMLEKNTTDKSVITESISLGTVPPDVLTEILLYKLKKQNLKFDDTKQLRKKVQSLILKRQGELEGAWIVAEERGVYKEILTRQSERLIETPDSSDVMTILPEDIPETAKQLSPDDIFAELDSLIGMTDFKREIRNIYEQVLQIKQKQELGIEEKNPALHFCLTGNPGTGKTTVARILGKLFYAIDLLPTDKVVEVARDRIVAGYTGQTAIKTAEAVDSAMGGVLFVDEAYALKQDEGDAFGQEAIDTLLKKLEDCRGEFIAVFAGYEGKMEELMASNDGFRSRFSKKIHLPDYEPEELYQILMLYAKKEQYELTEEAKISVQSYLTDLYEHRDATFANARDVRNMYDQCKRNLASRVAAIPMDQRTKEVLMTFTADDIPSAAQKSEKPTPEQIFTELDSLIGMTDFKREIRIIYEQIVQIKQKQALGIESRNPAVHFCIMGNPGTGKTTVARILGKLLYAIDLLPTDKVVEVDREKVIAGYTGQTAIKTAEVVESAMGGILFVDEAYSLKQNEQDSFGQEAIDVLLKRLEDCRGEFVAVFAGYEHNMNDLMATNDGFRSRFTHFIKLPDYEPDELYQIFMLYARKEQYELTEEAKNGVRSYLTDLYEHRDAKFANARVVRNMYDQCKRNLTSRVAEIPMDQRTKELLVTLTADDIPAYQG